MDNDYLAHDPVLFSSGEEVYRNLIRSFQTKMLTQCQYESFCCYMRGHCDLLFTQDVMGFLEDYNAIISQAIQAIRSLLAENSHLKEMRGFGEGRMQSKGEVSNDAHKKKEADNNDEAREAVNEAKEKEAEAGSVVNDNEELIGDGIVIKQPLRQQLKRLSKGKLSYSGSNISHPFTNPIQPQQDINLQKAQHSKELEIIQKTNEILKQTSILQENQKYFLLNYSPNHSFKEFLSKIIEYKYDTLILDEILKDIHRLKKQQPTAKNTQQVTHQSFSGSLRSYNIKKQDQGPIQKPFVQFTSPYGQLFKTNG